LAAARKNKHAIANNDDDVIQGARDCFPGAFFCFEHEINTLVEKSGIGCLTGRIRWGYTPASQR
tara:strand:+ start:398 stop:589 length:192 start_codon:yes stop_codon:yes gene_type:complete